MKNEELEAIEKIIELEISEIRAKLIKEIIEFDSIYSIENLRSIKLHELVQVHSSMFINLRKKRNRSGSDDDFCNGLN